MKLLNKFLVGIAFSLAFVATASAVENSPEIFPGSFQNTLHNEIQTSEMMSSGDRQILNAQVSRQYPPPYYGSYYAWGKATNGWGYCYQWTNGGEVLNGGQPVPNNYCESVNPSFYRWGRAQNGWGYCYHYTPQGIPMDQGQPSTNNMCEYSSPSYYRWGKATNGYTYCYQYGNGFVLNQGQPVNNYYCQY